MGDAAGRVGGLGGASRRAVVAMAVLVVAVTAAGCSGGDDAAAGGTTTTAAATSATAPTASTTTTAPAPLPPRPGTGGVTITPDPVPIGASASSAQVRVTWTGQKPATLIFVRICRRSVTDEAFSDGVDCSLLSELTPNGTPDGSGTVDLTLFRGENPDGGSGWGCFAPGDPIPPGVQGDTTCYVRVTNDVARNTTDDRDAPFTFQVS